MTSRNKKPMGKAFKKLRNGDVVHHMTRPDELWTVVDFEPSPLPDYGSKVLLRNDVTARWMTCAALYSLYSIRETAS